MADRVSIDYNKLIEACEYDGYDLHVLETKIPAVRREQSQGKIELTLKQLEKVSKETHYPFGFFFTSLSPQKPKTPVPDLRTVGSEHPAELSHALRTQLDLCQNRVDWYREYALAEQFEKVDLVGSCRQSDSPEEVARKYVQLLKIKDIRETVHENKSSAFAFFKALRAEIEDHQILTEASGIAGSNTKATFDIKEFRGFAITDDYAPLIFVNKKDAPTAQIFTLMHELGHILLGESGVFNTADDAESWCNRFAAELLVPSSELTQVHSFDEIKNVADYYFVSPQVIAFRLKKHHLISDTLMNEAVSILKQRPVTKKAVGGGGDAIRNLSDRLSRRFANALISSAQSGHTLFRDAFRLLGANGRTFWKLANSLEKS